MRAHSLTSCLVLALVASARAQEGEPGAAPQDGAASGGVGSVLFDFRAGGHFGFEADVDEDGEMSVSTYAVGIAARTRLGERVGLTVTGGFGIEMYDFDDAVSFGGDPWDDIHVVSLAATLDVSIDEHWTIYGGPILEFSREAGADWDDAVRAGGLAGFVYDFGDGRRLGLGAGILSEIEDSATLFPAITVNWPINEHFRIADGGIFALPGRGGLELVWDACEDWEAAIGASYVNRRFRLDDEGIAPDGVGEHTRFPVWLRVSHQVNENVRINAFAGLSFGNELTLEDRRGDRIAQEDADGGIFAGASIRITF